MEGSSQRKVRGPTRCLDLYGLPDGQKIPVAVNDRGQPVGPNASKLNNFCGTLARDNHLLPLFFNKWHDVNDEDKEKAWRRIEAKFDINESLKDYVMKSLNKKWRDYKADLKRKFYEPFETDAERYDAKPHDVLEEQWLALIHFWNSPAGKERCERNKNNRSKQKLQHTTGSTTFANVRQREIESSSTQASPTRVEMFIKTHSRKDNTPVNEDASEKIRQMRELIEEGSQDTTGRNDVFSKVMGPERHGRIRGYGLGPTPTKIWGSSSSNCGPSSSPVEVTMLQEKVNSLEEQLHSRDAEMTQQICQIKQQVEQQMEERLEERLEERVNERVQQVKQQMEQQMQEKTVALQQQMEEMRKMMFSHMGQNPR